MSPVLRSRRRTALRLRPATHGEQKTDRTINRGGYYVITRWCGRCCREIQLKLWAASVLALLVSAAQEHNHEEEEEEEGLVTGMLAVSVCVARVDRAFPAPWRSWRMGNEQDWSWALSAGVGRWPGREVLLKKVKLRAVLALLMSTEVEENREEEEEEALSFVAGCLRHLCAKRG